MNKSFSKRFLILVAMLAAFAFSAPALARMQEEQIAKLQALTPQEPLKFAVITDTHVPFDDAGIFSRLPGIFKRLNVQFAIIVGDMVQVGNPYNFNILFGKLKKFDIPVLPNLGNHDTSFSDYSQWPEYTKRIGDDYYYVDFGPIRLISMNNAPRVEFDSKQLDWLEQTLKTDKIPIVYFHRPLCYIDTELDPEKVNLDPATARFKAIVEAAKVPLVFNGHTHYYIHKIINGVEYVVSAGAGGAFEKGHEDYHDTIVVTVDKGKVTNERVKIPLEAEPGAGGM